MDSRKILEMSARARDKNKKLCKSKFHIGQFLIFFITFLYKEAFYSSCTQSSLPRINYLVSINEKMAQFMDIDIGDDYRPPMPRVYRLRNSPFNEYRDNEFYTRYRMDKNCARILCDELRDDLRRKSKRNHALTVETQVLTALRFYGSGSFQVVTGDTIGISQPSMSKVVTGVSKAICLRLRDRYIKLPSAAEAIIQKRKFYDIAGFPGVISCIDGTHIRIVKPNEDEEQYVNRKSYHSVNVQGACNANYEFTNVVVKWPGSTHDSFMLRDSHFWTTMEADSTLGIVLGDSAYPLRYWLMTPIYHPATQDERRYNSMHSKTRVTIEQAFGQLKRRFNVLHQENRRALKNLAYDVMACFILHNFVKRFGQPDFYGPDLPPPDANLEPEAEDVVVGDERRLQIMQGMR